MPLSAIAVGVNPSAGAGPRPACEWPQVSGRS